MTETSPDRIQVVLVTTAKERAAVMKSWGEAHRMFEHLGPRFCPTVHHPGTVYGLPIVVRPNYHVYLACAAMGIPGYEVVTID